MNFGEFEKAAEEFLKTLELSSNEWYIYQTYIKLGICYKELGNLSLATENLNSGLTLAGSSKGDDETRKNWMAIGTLFMSEIEELKANN